MGLSFGVSNKIFFFLGLIFELWFILMYALDYGYKFYPQGTPTQEFAYGFLSYQGFLLVLFLLLLFFLGTRLITQALRSLTPTSPDLPIPQPSSHF